MSQALKQVARRRAAEAFQKRREEHLAREAIIRDLVVEATTAFLERKRVISLAERRIAAALCELEELAVATAEAAALCGIEPREVVKLKRSHREEPR
ncbi:hypothetical protein H5399_00630 [Tessaracoccus sp. MC1627]|uniref:hypothetical protein n=1 Tax=Tessaracoccus sp. MC1627 TaxID=2760312 RepID=UPI00160405D4|nr:hypothetical protein [Tessaracoccus sp. MC1627]MBB1511116.1 hypothetical protein [Tessaracoccus sp. MC1627]